jgi:hypothetical protein
VLCWSVVWCVVCSVLYPRRVTHVLCKGVANTYLTHGGITRGPEVHTAYQLPVSPPVPCDVQYLETVSPRVPVSALWHVRLWVGGWGVGWGSLGGRVSGKVCLSAEKG